MICNECGLPFDESDLKQVINHEHTGFTTNLDIKGKRIISHAKDIFPNAPLDFCIGVNAWISQCYDDSTIFRETDDFRIGYFRAKFEELEKDYTLERN